MIRFCPNCKGNLLDKKYLAQHCKECDTCKGRYFTIETTQPTLTLSSPQGENKTEK